MDTNPQALHKGSIWTMCCLRAEPLNPKPYSRPKAVYNSDDLVPFWHPDHSPSNNPERRLRTMTMVPCLCIWEGCDQAPGCINLGLERWVSDPFKVIGVLRQADSSLLAFRLSICGDSRALKRPHGALFKFGDIHAYFGQALSKDLKKYVRVPRICRSTSHELRSSKGVLLFASIVTGRRTESTPTPQKAILPAPVGCTCGASCAA